MMSVQLPWWIQIPAALLLVASGLLAVIGTSGLLRLKSFFERIHGPTLGNTFGAFFLLLASMLVSSVLEQRLVVHHLIITVLLVVTSPVTAMLIMRAAIKRKTREENRELLQDVGYEPPPEDPQIHPERDGPLLAREPKQQ